MSRFYLRSSDRSIEAGLATTTTTGGGNVSAVKSFTVFKDTTNSTANDGGSFCRWVPPAGTKWVQFDAWGGGGEGIEGVCCHPATGAGAGSYTTRTLKVTDGDVFEICSAGTTARNAGNGANYGCNGWWSFVKKNGTQVLCATGGLKPTNRYCLQGYNCCSSCTYPGNVSPCNNTAGEGGYFITGVAGYSYMNYYCYQHTHSTAPYPPMTSNGFRVGRSGHMCQGFPCGANMAGAPIFPGGGGFSGNAEGGSCCYGQHGGGGLVVVTYG